MKRPKLGRALWRTGNVVPDLTAVILVVIAIIGLFDERPWITFVCALVVIVALVSRLWARLALAEVTYRPEISEKRLVAGDSFRLTLSIANEKPIPVPWLQLRETIPPGLVLAGTEETDAARTFSGGFEINEAVGMGGYQKVKLSVDLRAARRGRYTFGSAKLKSGDIFGFYRAEATERRDTPDLTVYPKPADLSSLLTPAGRPLGDSLIKHSYVEDTSRPRGLREYRAGDSPRKIDWKSSAKRDAMFVRTYDPSVSQNVVLALECETGGAVYWRVDAPVLENAISTAAALVAQTLDRGVHLGFICNGTPLSGETPPVIPPRAGPGQAAEIMNCLAAASAITTRPIESLAARHGPRAIPVGATILYVAGVVRKSTIQFLRERNANGNRVRILYCGREDPPQIPGLEVIDIRAAFDLAPESETSRNAVNQ